MLDRNFSHYSMGKRRNDNSFDTRIKIVGNFFTLLGFVVIARLFFLMVLQHDIYSALAAGSHEVSAKLFPERGEIFIQDSRTKKKYPLAINRDYFIVFADTRKIDDKEKLDKAVNSISELLNYTPEKKEILLKKLSVKDDPYVPIEQKVEEDAVNLLKEKKLSGIYFARKPSRYYPEGKLASHVSGFVGKDENGQDLGRYGIEGFWQETLSGKGGILQATKSPTGGLITMAGMSLKPAENGADLLLTIDRAVQFKACETLRQALVKYKAAGGALIVMDPFTGAIRAMCSFPDYNPNEYNKVESGEDFNNKVIFTPYEPGSIFKPIGMAAALNEGVLTPQTTFVDKGSRTDLCFKSITNVGNTVFGLQTMVGVLENSINTGMIFVAEKLGKEKFRDYIEKFGFGLKEGIELDTEAAGTINSLYQNKGDKIDCYAGTASFGQGITATPLQMATAFSALANGGVLMKPYIVEEVSYDNGKIEKIKPKEIRRVLEPQTSALLGGMLVKVVDAGEGRGAKVKGYYVAGKTGTAQIAEKGQYIEEKNHSFAGFAPIDDPKFVIIIKIEKPEMKFASLTAAPVFSDIAEFLLQYYSIPPNR